MQTFESVREAKEFLIGKLLDQAARDGYPMSEIERKMLYFSETGWTLPDSMRVNELFTRDYDTPAYEWKIRHLAKNFRKEGSLRKPEELACWDEALGVLRGEDHYLLVLIDVPPEARPTSGQRVKLIGVAVAIAAAIVVGMFLFAAYTR